MKSIKELIEELNITDESSSARIRVMNPIRRVGLATTPPLVRGKSGSVLRDPETSSG